MTAEDWASGGTIDGLAIPSQPHLGRMRRERYRKVQEQMEAQGVDGLVLLASSAVAYVSGANVPGDDSGRAGLFRPVAIVVRGDSAPHLYTPFTDVAPEDLPDDHLHGPLYPDLDDGIEEFEKALAEHFAAGANVGVDDQTHAMLRHLNHVNWTDAGSVMSPCKLRKTPDEVACIRTAQHINELAMLDAQALCRPGIRQTDLSGAFLRRVFELGASAGSVDPIWQVMTPTKEVGPWTLHGDLAYPTSTTDRFLREGDVIWVDVGILWEGYASDYGRTWIASAVPVPNQRQASQFRRWRGVVDAVMEVLKPGVSALQLGRTAIEANGGTRPWIQHFYLAHGVGTDSAEMPLIGTDLGDAFDETQIMEPGMVLVFEPIIWDQGAAGYRSEDIVVVTDTGWVMLSGSTYDPFQVAA